MQLEVKYFVLKWADIEAVLTEEEQRHLARISKIIAYYRKSQGKPENNYVVINLDEPYAPDVLRLMEQAESE